MSNILSPLQLQSGPTLLANQGIIPGNVLTGNISAYRLTSLLKPLEDTFVVNSVSNVLASGTVANLWTMSANTCPALSDSIPSAEVANLVIVGNATGAVNTNAGMTNMLLGVSYTYLGKTFTFDKNSIIDITSSDNSKFTQAISISSGYSSTVNVFIESATNSSTYLEDTFTSMNDLMSSNLTQVNIATSAMGNDLANLGKLIDLNNLGNLGSPATLVQQVCKIAGIVAPFIISFSQVGIPDNIILSLNQPDLVITDSVQKLMYQAMNNITGDDLTQILQILNVTTPGISSMADLLDPSKLFPTCYKSLTAPTCAGLRGIYLSTEAVPTVNSNLRTTLSDTGPGISLNRLSAIILPELALANKALSVSLQQITNVNKLTLERLSVAYKGIQTTKGLEDISNPVEQSEPVSQSVRDYYTNNLAKGSGENGTLLITDFLGTAIGAVHGQELQTVVSTLNSMELTALTDIYTDMYKTISGDYGDPSTGPIIIPSGPAAGTYSDADDAFSTGLIPVAIIEIGNIVVAYPSQVLILNTAFDNMSQKVLDEYNLFQKPAQLIFSQLQSGSQLTIFGFIQSLSSYGQQTKLGGEADFIEQVADINNVDSQIRKGAQSIVGSLREGRTNSAIAIAGLPQDNKISSTPRTPSPQIPASQSNYTENEAIGQVIT